MRPIDADALMEKMKHRWERFGRESDCICLIEDAQTIDAVPVVRCEKCRHGIKNHGISDGWVLCTKPYVTDTVGAMMHRDDWFCADGERRTESAEDGNAVR